MGGNGERIPLGIGPLSNRLTPSFLDAGTGLPMILRLIHPITHELQVADNNKYCIMQIISL